MPIPTSRARRRPALGAPLIQPRTTVAHRASSRRAEAPAVVLKASSRVPRRPPPGAASAGFRAPPKGGSSVQVGTLLSAQLGP